MKWKDSDESGKPEKGSDGRKEGKMAKKKTGSSRGSLILIILFLWVAGLTALFVMQMKQAGGDVEERLARLESSRSSKVVRKVNSISKNDLEAIKKRIENLEQGIAQASAGGQTPGPVAAGGACNCDDLGDRVKNLEAAMNNRQTASAPTPAVSDASQPADVKPTVQAKVSPKKAVRQKKVVRQRKKAKRRPRKTIVRTPVSRKIGDTVRPRPVVSGDQYYTKHSFSQRYDEQYGGASVYEISRRFAPMHTYTGAETRSIESLAPGAAIYPDRSGSYVSTALSK